ncbi:MAG: hypothetical protein RR177_01405 [Oscillospiraceae bacterium]
MLKGVSKQIIEVNNTGNKYFEKALIFVRPQYLNASRSKLDDEAENYLRSLGPATVKYNSGFLRKKYIKKHILRVIYSLAFAVVALVLIYLVLS